VLQRPTIRPGRGTFSYLLRVYLLHWHLISDPTGTIGSVTDAVAAPQESYFGGLFEKGLSMHAATPATVSTAHANPLRLRFAIAIWSGLLLAVTTTCSPEQTALPRSSSTATVQCEKVILPQITEVRPAQAIAGSEMSVIGYGGYIDSCGLIIEGDRSFKLYLDNIPLAN
jgi:hypothetical protein